MYAIEKTIRFEFVFQRTLLFIIKRIYNCKLVRTFNEEGTGIIKLQIPLELVRDLK